MAQSKDAHTCGRWKIEVFCVAFCMNSKQSSYATMHDITRIYLWHNPRMHTHVADGKNCQVSMSGTDEQVSEAEQIQQEKLTNMELLKIFMDDFRNWYFLIVTAQDYWHNKVYVYYSHTFYGCHVSAIACNMASETLSYSKNFCHGLIHNIRFMMMVNNASLISVSEGP
ncbi:uncharacterized protein LOC118202306 isoform X1 [Stegodyphus dumicola]|uniref:uncharacterized protein LOC118202306 isoform X1 n=1 Tax=Stegodyphus dumicola TaxID=202533 RepID=UPI0015A7EFA1|nr:uncharacterized protein LOC118202306 isoform X1 [Stegodyphus dumicola]